MAERDDMTTARCGVGSVRFHRPAHRRCRGGQILVMALLAIGLMVGVTFYVYNVGRHVNTRLTMQNVADSVAISGANWTARSMNVIAMNNCAQSRMLAIVPILDSLPLATEMALDEVTAWEHGLREQIERVPPTQEDYLGEGMRSLRMRLNHQKKVLQQFDDMFDDSLDMRTVTHWAIDEKDEDDDPRPHGSLWRTMMALEEFSFVTWQSSAALAQANAVRFGEANGADVALLLPLTPTVPAIIGEYTDFRPVIEGKLRINRNGATMATSGGAGGATPDFAYPHRLGPWNGLYKWRGFAVPMDPNDVAYDSADPDRFLKWRLRGGGDPLDTELTVFDKGLQSTGGTIIYDAELMKPGNDAAIRAAWWGRPWVESPIVGNESWHTYGPYWWALSIALASGDYVPDTYYPSHIVGLANAKLNYMFAPPGESKVETIYRPKWIYTDDYPAAKQLAENLAAHPDQDGQKITRTLWYWVKAYSSEPFPEDDPFDQEVQPTPDVFISNGGNPLAIWFRGWVDLPRGARPGGARRVGDYFWRIRYTVPNRKGGLIYMEEHVIWGGIDVGDDVEVRNPFNWEEGEQLPRPLLFDPGPVGELDYMYDNRIGYGFLGIVRQETKAKVWPSRFADITGPDEDVPLDDIFTIAQAKLFNNRSWDLWTQDWQVQLTPISQWDEWLWELEVAQWEVAQVGKLVDEQELIEIDEYLGSIDEDMITRFLKH